MKLGETDLLIDKLKEKSLRDHKNRNGRALLWERGGGVGASQQIIFFEVVHDGLRCKNDTITRQVRLNTEQMFNCLVCYRWQMPF